MAIYPQADSDRRVPSDVLLDITGNVFERCGMPADKARLLAETLVHSDLRGVHSHGVLRVPDYVGKLVDEGVDPAGEPVVLTERGSAIVVDGANSMGQIGGTFAMDRAIDCARTRGVAFAALGGSNHCGALDWYTMRAARANMIGIAGTNALPTMAPLGGIDKIVGINPLSIAMPANAAGAFVLDFAFGATAHGKIRVYAQKGAPIPGDWALDAEGHPTTDAKRALEGLISPIGGHKGVGLGMAIGMLSTLLSGAGYGTELGNMVDGPTAGRDGQFFLALDIASFVDPAVFRDRVDTVVAQIHGSRRREGVERVHVPGEIERDVERDHEANGILLSAETIDGIAGQASRLDVDASALFGSA